jgi:hypothetical protein
LRVNHLPKFSPPMLEDSLGSEVKIPIEGQRYDYYSNPPTD